jgi:hypothetical protein
LDSSSVKTLGNLVTLTIEQDNKVSMLMDSSITPVQGEIINQTSTQLLIANIDSVEVLVPPYINKCDILNITSVNPERNYYPLPTTTGFNGFYKFRPTFPVEIKNGELVLPLISYVVSHSSGSISYCYTCIKNEWNTFNSSTIGQLQPGDTILYQTKELSLFRQ